jgi:hypothetical protein
MKLGSPVKASLSPDCFEGTAGGSDAGAFRGLSSGKGSPPGGAEKGGYTIWPIGARYFDNRP